MRIATTLRHHLGARYEQVRDAALVAEGLGFDALYFPDHYLPTDAQQGGDVRVETVGELRAPVGPADVWSILAGLSRETSRIRLGTMMTSSTFRLPGPLAILVAQVNEMSGGRIDFGLGTNWFVPEHTAYGIPFPPQRERFERLEEQFAVVTSLWQEPPLERVTFTGAYYQLEDAAPIPAPPQSSHARVIVGGTGLRRTPALAARFADEANTPAHTAAAVATFYAACDAACEKIGRDPGTLARSVIASVLVGEDERDMERQAAMVGHTVEDLRASIFVGTPSELVERIREFEGVGVESVVLSRRLPIDLPGMRLIAQEVIPHVRGDAT